MKFAFIDVERATFPVEVLCRVLGVSSSGYYASRKRPESRRSHEDTKLRVLCKEAHARSRGNYGSVRIHLALQKQGVFVSRKRVVRLMQLDGIRGKRRRRWTRTTSSGQQFPAALNLLNRDFTPSAPNLAWAGDVTVLRAHL